ncbi:halo transducer protein [Halosimplex sp. J119]
MTDSTHDAGATDETSDADAGGDEHAGAADGEEAAAGSLDGLSLDKATERVVARECDRDPETVRAALEYVADDGVVSAEAVEETLKSTSKLVTTAETRTELARIALDDAREAAESVADVPAVASRIDRFEAEVSAVEDRAAALGDSLQSVVADRTGPETRFAVADGIRRIENRSRSVQREADDLQFDLEAFERWLGSHEARVASLEEDVDALASSLDDLAAAVDDLADETADDETDVDATSARAWFDATLRVRVIDLTVADLRAELDDLQTLADREDEADGESGNGLADLEARLDDVDERRAGLTDRLDGLATPAWRDRYGDRIDGFERDLDALAPPVEWGAVQRALEERRSGADSME